MLDALFSAPGNGAQSLPEKFCPDCGAPVAGRTLHKQYCEDCKRRRKLDSNRRAAEVQRRKKGVSKVKGETFACVACGSKFVATSKSRAKYCNACRVDVSRQLARERSYANDRGGERNRIGRAEACAHCGVEFLVETRGGNHRYCADCQKLQKANKLPSLRKTISIWRRARYRSDPKFALNEFMRGGILKSLGDKKGGDSWTAFVDYTVDELKAHLDRQFLPGMTWENRGVNGWHIDHIIPVSSFNYDGPEHPDFKACWALTNLRPMWAVDNIRKKDKRLYLI